MLSQVSSYPNSHNLCNTFQSFLPDHSTDTALLKSVNVRLLSLNKGNMSVLASLNFSSAFDTIDHSILVHRRHTVLNLLILSFNGFHLIRLIVHSTSLYLIIVLPLLLHTQVFLRVQFMALCFLPCILSLCLPLLTHTLSHTIHLLMAYNYRCLLPQIEYLSYITMQSCIRDVKALTTANMLKINDNMTELMLVTSKSSKHIHYLPTSITIDNAQILLRQSVKNLGVTLDCHLTMNAYVSNIAKTCYLELRRLHLFVDA